jgi:lipid II isoglutaminyl synthase (glutamine-hydrolysing)
VSIDYSLLLLTLIFLHAMLHPNSYVNWMCWRKRMSEQNPPDSAAKEARKRKASIKTKEQLQANPSSKGTRGEHVSKRRNRSSLRAGLAVMGGRAAGALSRRLHLGGGTSIAGMVAQRLYPNIVEHLSNQLAYGSVLVTGTNGKTTTSGFIAAILSDAGLRVWRNREGSNLMQGVAGSLVIRAQPDGTLRRAGQAISIFEIDEAVMPQAVQILPPRAVVFTNLFRDQLDRFGEVDSVSRRWQQAINLLPENAILVLNADDPTTAFLSEAYPGQVVFFGIDDPSFDLANEDTALERHQVLDTRTCPSCGGELVYLVQYYSHLGHYQCMQCKRQRPEADVRAVKVVTDGIDRLRIQIETQTQHGEIVVPLAGFYNVYNALAAIATTQTLGINWEPIVSGIEQFKPAFGRGERVHVEGRTLRLLLAKNPTGFNEVLRTLFNDGIQRHVLFVLNDNIADGQDISWIWDIDFERSTHQIATLTVAGTRAFDLALRLKLAGIEQETMTIVNSTPLRALKTVQESKASKPRQNRRKRKKVAKQITQMPVLNENTSNYGLTNMYGISHALDTAIQQTPSGETLFVIPTYTGLLEIHHELERRGLTPRYWEESGP